MELHKDWLTKHNTAVSNQNNIDKKDGYEYF